MPAHARALGLELEFLPTYSPNLNLIERYWRWVNKQCLTAKYYEDFATMKTALLKTTSQFIMSTRQPSPRCSLGTSNCSPKQSNKPTRAWYVLFGLLAVCL